MTPEDIAAWHAGNVGVGGATAAAAALLFPNDAPAWALAYLRGTGARRPSTCALYGMSYLRWRGVSHPKLDAGYAGQIGMAPATLEEAARSVGAWSTDPDELATFPEPGDIVRIGGLGVGELHIVCPTGADAASGAVESVDGGQLPDSTYVQKCHRIMVLDAHEKPWLVRADVPFVLGLPNGRPITARVVGARLP